MKFKAEQIAGLLDGEIKGNPKVEVFKLAKIEEAAEGSLTFLANPKYLKFLYSTKASIIIMDSNFIPEQPLSATIIKVSDPYKSFTRLLEYYNEVKMMKSGIEQPSVISESVQYGENLYLGSFCYIGCNVKIGDNVKIYPNSFLGDNVYIGDNSVVYAGVRIYSETQIGRNCIIHSGSVIGSDGFGFTAEQDGTYKKVPQIGNVVVEDNVEIGANTTIDRATLGSTIIRNGVKLDNQVHIAHNVEVGSNTIIAGQTGIAGSTKIGINCLIGGQAGIIGHLNIGNNVQIQAQSGVTKSIKDNTSVQGTPSINHSDFHRSYVHFKNLPKIVDDISALKRQHEAESI
ncbi:UDP-3-O-(3-hydroxymyristoyl)glucosamine N-acyltransferase [Flavobacterium pectinovorum]|uniref:UDP-3-O-acylglucosamine N-acyltransferase n=1 Tax=Flavobacterium pectinovorum TaxID=29533 RepID=A0AB36P6M9_9FLAO|nr:UDP-3-O-(3-hydroxymyristoyl)glucosamine N-acyltransferase [Flavobacterium pectinovorum]OXB07834.1 UDP-3-O-(3-hydroxymyristoyl)glucosamine N-acyltransferase [Flavobacterium pectinovorum]SHM82120.1 UDP-3-O-[3-hydroxymyristoyl] glucosamine N-acyltransferase [Flavobacterium pectinovorum]